MGLIPIAILYGAPITVENYIKRSMVPSGLGNWIGAGWLLGFPMVYLYAWKSRTFKSLGPWLRFNFVPTTTLAEEWATFRYKLWNNVEPVTEVMVAVTCSNKCLMMTEKMDVDVESKAGGY